MTELGAVILLSVPILIIGYLFYCFRTFKVGLRRITKKGILQHIFIIALLTVIGLIAMPGYEYIYHIFRSRVVYAEAQILASAIEDFYKTHGVMPKQAQLEKPLKEMNEPYGSRISYLESKAVVVVRFAHGWLNGRQMILTPFLVNRQVVWQCVPEDDADLLVYPAPCINSTSKPLYGTPLSLNKPLEEKR